MLWDKVTGTVTVTEPLCSAPVVAPDPTEPLIRLLRENGCVLSRGDVAKFADYGLTFEMADRMSAYLIELGTVRVAHGPTLVLDNCPE